MSGGTIKGGNVQIGQDGTASNNFTIYQPAVADGTSRWAVGVAGATTSDVITVKNNGQVGFGVSNPGYTLDAAGQYILQGTGYQPFITLRDSNASNQGIRIVNASANTLFFNDNVGSGSYTERMRIDSSGLLGLNTVPNGYGQFAIKWDATATANNGSGIGIYPTANTSGAKFLFFYNEAGSGIGSISRNTTTNAVLYNTSSDYRLKADVKPLENALHTISQLKPISFTWDGTEHKDTGFIAHELAEVIPNIVTGEKDATTEDGKPIYQSVDYSKLVATLVAAIKELKAEIDALKGAK